MNQAEQAQESADVIGVMAELNRGRYLLECGRQFRRLLDGIIQTGKKGKLIMSLEVIPGAMTQGRASQMEITPKVKIEEPLASQGTSIFFVSDDNKLSRNDPEQMDMFEKEQAR